MLGERIVKNAAQYPERIAICYGDQNYTYGELIQDIQETSTIIQELTKNRLEPIGLCGIFSMQNMSQARCSFITRIQNKRTAISY